MAIINRDGTVNQRATALATITAEVALHGYVTTAAIRLYTESKISRAAFNGACAAGMRAERERMHENARVQHENAQDLARRATFKKCFRIVK